MSSISEQIEAAAAKLHANADALEKIINGPADGNDSTVALPLGGTQITVAKALLQLGINVANLLSFENEQVLSQAQKAVALGNLGIALFGSRLDSLEASQGSGRIGRQTQALLFADLAHDENTLAEVTNDSPNNGVYIKVGASGAGSWLKGTTDVLARLIELESGTPFRELLASDFAAFPLNFSAVGDIIPLLADQTGKVAIGVETATGKLIGSPSQSFMNAIGLIGLDPSKIEIHFDKYIPGASFAVIDQNYKIATIISEAGTGLTQASSGQSTTTEQFDFTDVNHLLFYGQSLSVGAQARPVISTSQQYSNLTFVGGPRSGLVATGDLASFIPLVEDQDSPAPDGGTNRGETPCSGCANIFTKLVNDENGIAHNAHSLQILSSTAGDGGEPINNLLPSNSRFQLLRDHIDRGYANAIAQNKTYSCPVLCYMQGESDEGANANNENRTTWQNKLVQIKNAAESHIQSVTGRNDDLTMLCYQMSFRATESDAFVALAQLDAMEAEQGIILVCPTYRIPHDGDGVHLTNVGSLLMGAYFGKVAKRLLYDGSDWRPLYPKTITNQARIVDIIFNVPVGALEFDSTILPAVTDQGFKLVDDTGDVGIDSVTISANNRVRIVASRDFGTNAKVRYGMDNLGAGMGITAGGSGNLRDSDPATETILGVNYDLHNWCLHFEKSIN